MGKIRVLDEHTINKIAAGEVIENPSSVVKELVENAIDAGSTEITVEIVGGGRELIRISDNGSGMSPDDALLCFERHATSKIRNVEEIFATPTMGFRGEALPSIASISLVSLLTSDGFKPTLTLIEGGKIKKQVAAERAQGSTVEVKQLFYNVPVRMKFQRSPTYDASEIQRIVTSLALGNPEIKFTLIHNAKELLRTAHEDQKARISSILGNEYIKLALPLSIEEAGFSLQGWIGKPGIHKQNRAGQYLFINKRGVFSKELSDMVQEGYGTALPERRHPLFVLHLTLPYDLVDVNVHPQKKSVRLRQEETLRHVVLKGVEQAVFKPFTERQAPSISLPPLRIQGPELRLSAPIPEFSFEQTKEIPSLSFEVAPSVLETICGYVLLEGYFLSRDVFPETEGLFLLDQHLASERILFERLQKKGGGVGDIEQLLLPIPFSVNYAEAKEIIHHLPDFQKMGIGIEEFGSGSFLIHALPKILEKGNIQEMIHQILMKLKEFGHDGRDELRQKWMARMAATYALSQKGRLSKGEAKGLVSELMKCQVPYLSPFGKPTIVQMKKESLEKLFTHK